MIKKVIIATAIFIAPALGFGADITVNQTPGGSFTVDFKGIIASGDDEIFKKKVADLPELTLVMLDSGGGNLAAGLEIGTEIRFRRFRTAVNSQSECASACGLAWLGGVVRMVAAGGRVGFHAAYNQVNGSPQEVGVGNALVGAYLTRLGLSFQAVSYITSEPPQSMQWLSLSDARRVGINMRMLTAEGRWLEVEEGKVSAPKSKPPSAPLPLQQPPVVQPAPPPARPPVPLLYPNSQTFVPQKEPLLPPAKPLLNPAYAMGSEPAVLTVRNAISDILSQYRKNEIEGLQQSSEKCYAQIPIKRNMDIALYCYTFDNGSAILNFRLANSGASTPHHYFSAARIATRANWLFQTLGIESKRSQNEILQAWGDLVDKEMASVRLN